MPADLITVDHDGLTFAMTREVAVKLRAGDLDPDVAYMRGQLKVSGEMARFYELLPLARNDAFREAIS